ncbi:hypothetical protein OHW51_18235 [Acinetobacter baumannii]|nr:hypothetical protein [Acinetobacter baumannii]
MKGPLLLVLTLSISISSHAAIDIYPNPNLTDPSLATIFSSQLRKMKIKEMEEVIKGECNQFKEYAYLSTQNWEDLKKKRKSIDEAEQYSQQLVREMPYKLSFQYTFPLGIRMYSIAEEHIKLTTLNSDNFDKYKLIDSSYDVCISMNNIKYFELLTNQKYLTGNESPFASDSQILQKFDPSNSFFKSISPVPSETDKLTPPNMTQSINFTDIEFGIAYVLINEDIRNSFLQSDIRWIDYKKSSREMQENFNKFMSKGGRNKKFAQIATVVKVISPQIIVDNIPPNNDVIMSTLKKIELKNDPIVKKKMEDLLKMFNYQN